MGCEMLTRVSKTLKGPTVRGRDAREAREAELGKTHFPARLTHPRGESGSRPLSDSHRVPWAAVTPSCATSSPRLACRPRAMASLTEIGTPVGWARLSARRRDRESSAAAAARWQEGRARRLRLRETCGRQHNRRGQEQGTEGKGHTTRILGKGAQAAGLQAPFMKSDTRSSGFG